MHRVSGYLTAYTDILCLRLDTGNGKCTLFLLDLITILSVDVLVGQK